MIRLFAMQVIILLEKLYPGATQRLSLQNDWKMSRLKIYLLLTRYKKRGRKLVKDDISERQLKDK